MYYDSFFLKPKTTVFPSVTRLQTFLTPVLHVVKQKGGWFFLAAIIFSICKNMPRWLGGLNLMKKTSLL